jgi:hypothetical protein
VAEGGLVQGNGILTASCCVSFSWESWNKSLETKKQRQIDENPAGKSPIRTERQKTGQLPDVVRLQLFPCMGQFPQPTLCSQGSSDARNQYDA